MNIKSRSGTKDGDYQENPDKQVKVRDLEEEIEKLVYELYELTPEEIEVFENFNIEKTTLEI